MLAEHPDIQLPDYPASPGKKEFNFWNEYKPRLSTEGYIDTFRVLADKKNQGRGFPSCTRNKVSRSHSGTSSRR